ncbi:o-fucosyltransferase 13, partial [Quercus suber]
PILIESVLPSLLEHHYISITPAVSQRRDRYYLVVLCFLLSDDTGTILLLGLVDIPVSYFRKLSFTAEKDKYPHAKASLCHACYSALRLTRSLENKASKLLEANQAIPKPFLSLHLQFEPDMVAYSQCEYLGLSPSSVKAIEATQGDRKPWTGELAQTNIYLAAEDGQMEIEGLTSVYTNVVTKSFLLSDEDFTSMNGNTKAALDYYVSIDSDSYVATYFGNMDKMVAAM